MAKHVIRGVFWLSSHVDAEIADSYTKLLLNVPATAMVEFNESSLDEESKKSVLRRVWLARRTLLSKPQKFKTEQFSAVMDLLLNGTDNGLVEMLERGVWWSGRETRGNLAATTQEIFLKAKYCFSFSQKWTFIVKIVGFVRWFLFGPVLAISRRILDLQNVLNLAQNRPQNLRRP